MLLLPKALLAVAVAALIASISDRATAAPAPFSLTFEGAHFAGAKAGSLPAATPEPELELAASTLPTAKALRLDVSRRHGAVPGRKLVVTESTSMGVVDSVTLVTDWLAEPRIVSTANGVYFAIRSTRARRPYWRLPAFPPRQIALELAARMFADTSVRLVVVSLPTARPTWVLFERDEFARDAEVGALPRVLMGDPADVDETLRDLVDRLSGSRLYEPLPILPPPPGTIIAVRVTAW